jgi:DnaJ-class molecular chaperone
VTAPRRDPYEVLGVPRDADLDAIRRAYRERALRDHPDRNPGDAAAAERFKSASEAYATLRDPDARRRYDAVGPSGGRGARPDFSTVDWRTVFQEADVQVDWSRYAGQGGIPTTGHVVFDMLFRGVARAFRQAGLLPGEERLVHTRIDLASARAGGTARVRLPGPTTCPRCRGAATSGLLCTECQGAGVARNGVEVDVTLPKGVRSGQKLRLAGMGGPGRPPGDALVEIEVVLPAGVTLRGRDLDAEVVITPLEARQGVRLEVAGQLVTIAAGVEDGAHLRVAGGGLGGGELRLWVRVDTWRGLGRVGAQTTDKFVKETWKSARALWRKMASAGRKG